MAHKRPVGGRHAARTPEAIEHKAATDHQRAQWRTVHTDYLKLLRIRGVLPTTQKKRPTPGASEEAPGVGA